MKKYFVTAIGTNVGKTIISSILVEKLQADYWKPIQAGDLNASDSITVQSLISNPKSHIFKEAYQLQSACSPHLAAKLDHKTIHLDAIKIPNTTNSLIVEGAGGVLTPLNNHHLIIDLIQYLQLEVIVVTRNYLGSINHTLLTIDALQKRNIPLKGLIFNGEGNIETENFIQSYTNLPIIGKIPILNELHKDVIHQLGNNLSRL